MIKHWVTEVIALDPQTHEMKRWRGDVIKAPTWELAQQWCDENKGYLLVVGELIAEIDEDTGKRIDYDVARMN